MQSSSSGPAQTRTTADAFLRWASTRPEGKRRLELVDGFVVAMAAKRYIHSRAKHGIATSLERRMRGTPCVVLPDGFSVRIDDTTVFEPDASVYCGERLADNATSVSDVSIAFEVLSPSTRNRDLLFKVWKYLTLPSLVAVVAIDPDKRIDYAYRNAAAAHETFGENDTIDIALPSGVVQVVLPEILAMLT